MSFVGGKFAIRNECGHRHPSCCVVYEDNQSAIAIAQNDVYQSRAKHIDIRFHFVREQVKSKAIELQYIETKSQLADFLTNRCRRKGSNSL
jgi:hypothetical protein